MSCIDSLPRAILDFEQRKKESIGAAWARFSTLIHTGLDSSLPDSILLHLFCLGIDIKADLCLDTTARGCFTRKPMTEQVKFLENLLESYTSPVMRNKTLQAKVMSSVEEFSLVESKPIASLDSTNEPSPEQRTPNERVIYPLEFPIDFEDYCNTSKYFGHEKLTCPSEEVSPKIEPSKEWLLEVKHSSKAIRILSPSTTMPCSLRGTNIEALYNPIVRTSIMSEFIVKNILGNMPLVPTNKLFKSPLGLIFECCGIVRDVPIEINEIEVHVDFRIYAILDFDLLIGYPSKFFSKRNLLMGTLVKNVGKLLPPLT
jgi:hypothetical protein